MSEFEGQVVIVTGAAGNLGSAVGHAFHGAGARLVLVDHRLEVLEEAYADLEEEDTYLFVQADLTDAGAVEGMVYEAVQQFDRLDVLVNVAGGFRMGEPVHEMSLETWDFMMNLNARSVLLTARAVVPHMLQQKRGRVISVAARAAQEGQANMAAYVASKSAVVRLTESMSAELKTSGINVNCIMPGTMDTPQNRQSMPEADFDKWVAPEAIAEVIIFLASDASRAVHGACLPVYGLS